MNVSAARQELYELAGILSSASSNGNEAAITGKTLEDGSATLESNRPVGFPQDKRSSLNNWKLQWCVLKTRLMAFAGRQENFPKERLRAVPHTIQSMEAKPGLA